MSYRKLNLNTGKRRALLRNQATALLKNGRIQTTEPKAKEVRSIVEKDDYFGQTGRLKR